MKNRIFENTIAILGLENNAPRLISAQFSDGLWELKIRTLTLLFDVFYDPKTGEMPGVNCEPALDTEASYICSMHVLEKIA